MGTYNTGRIAKKQWIFKFFFNIKNQISLSRKFADEGGWPCMVGSLWSLQQKDTSL